MLYLYKISFNNVSNLCKLETKNTYKASVHKLQFCIFSFVLHKKYIYFDNKMKMEILYPFLKLLFINFLCNEDNSA